MSPFEDFVDEVEISITESVESLSPDDSTQLYAEILDAEQRLDALRRPLGVSVVGGTETMTIAYRADDPERARVGAQAFAESYLADRSSRAAAARDSSRQNLQAALRTATDRVGRLRASLATTAAG